MSDNGHHHIVSNTLAGKMLEATGESAARCYQCGKCSAGCPMSPDMEYPPSLVLRILQLELPEFDEKLLRSYSIWVCVTCETCFARCPQEVDIPVIMDFLRAESVRQKMVNPKAKDILSFHKSFLNSIKYTGRLFEVGLIAEYKARSFHLLQDLLLSPKLFFKGKLSPFPHLIKDRKGMSKIFSKTIGRKEASK
jgi:heterodisulfide reductase subunit C